MECVPPVRGSCKYHPQPSSIALVTQAIRAVNVRGLRVLDPFCGTGTIVCVAADNGALKALGSDIEDYTFCSRDPVYMAATSKGFGEAVIEVHYGIDAFEAISSYQYDIVITDPPNPWAVIGGAPISIKRDTGLNGAELARFWKPRFSDKNLIHGKETTVSAVSNLFAEVLGSGRRVVANLFVSRGRDYKDLLRDEFTFRPVAGTYYEIEMVEER
jgi:hypothetical protein